jgi:hypothetical protein
MNLLINRQQQRTKLHQLAGHFHCSVVGTCLTLDELRKMAHQLKLSINSISSDHDLHHIFVVIASESSYENRRLQKYLDKKYQPVIRQFAKIRSGEVLKTNWQEALKSGDVAGAYWAMVTHPIISEELLDEIYGEIHMLSHLSGASIRVDMLELSQLRQQNKELKGQVFDLRINTQKRLKEKDEIICILNNRLRTAELTKNQLQCVQAQLEDYEKEHFVEKLQKKNREFATQLTIEQKQAKCLEEWGKQWKSYAQFSEARHLNLEEVLEQTCQERDSLETSLSHLLNTKCSECSECKNCPNLCGRSILFVGGRKNMSRHFNHLVEQYNGNFIYHDGGREESHFKLESNLCQADAVLCPLDCISHDAMNKVKRYCKHNAKQLVMMPRASLSAFVNGLNEVANL